MQKSLVWFQWGAGCIVIIGLAACSASPIVTPDITATVAATATTIPTTTPTPYVPNGTPFPEGYNPLTGLTVADPSVLAHRPLVIKVSNESPEVRPQSGLSFADHVWEYQMEGFSQTRFSAIYYSQSPERVGSVRSARLIDVEHLVDMYDGLLVYSGCSIGVCYRIQTAPWGNNRAFREDGIALIRIPDIPRPGTDKYHSLFAIPDRVWQAAEDRGVNSPPHLQSMAFSKDVPAGGIGTKSFSINYPELGSLHRWEYDPPSQKWLSFTTDERSRGTEQPDTDLLTNQPLAFDNVILIYAEHRLADFVEDERNDLASVGINLLGKGDAVLMRDGVRFNCRWVRENPFDMIHLVDSEGNPLPLKSGTVWFNVYSSNMYQPDVAFTAH
jgi:hypothetical protein